MADLDDLIARAENLLKGLERLYLKESIEPNWSALAWRWQQHGHAGYLQAVPHPHAISLKDIQNIDTQKAEIVRNTRQFLQKLPANHVLLTGARGTGKSSLIKALLTDFANSGLRLVEVDKQDLVYLPDIVALLRNRPERFIVFCDDLSFESAEPSYKALKVVLDGTVAASSDNVLVYATSNRKHLMPEYMAENLETQHLGEEIRPGDTAEEKNALAERFGLWLSFYPFTQDEYLQVVQYWLSHFGISSLSATIRQAALQFSIKRGSRSGRVAFQFAKDYAGSQQLKA